MDLNGAITADELTKAMSKGKIGAGLVEQAFKNLTSESGLYFEGAIKQSETLNGKFVSPRAK